MIVAGHHAMAFGDFINFAEFNGEVGCRMRSEIVSVSPVTQPQISFSGWINGYQFLFKTVFSFWNEANNTGPTMVISDGSKAGYRIVFQYVTDFGYYYPEYNLNEWHHYCFSFKPGLMKIFYDGVAVITATNANFWLRDNKAWNLRLCLGAGGQDQSVAGFVGGIANVNLFDYALSDTEASLLASRIDVVPKNAYHQYLFENKDGSDTGVSSQKLNLEVGSTVEFKKV